MRRRSFWKDERGATAIEYGLIVSLIFVAIVFAVNQFASNTGIMFNSIANHFAGS
jgi:pilus assembly protein Flp/PilA